MVRHGDTGYLVNPEAPEDIATRLGELLSDAELRRRMGETAKECAQERFHPDTVAEKTARLYSDIVTPVYR
jgi:glycosyltransferase involved in cell wall biosynthesis